MKMKKILCMLLALVLLAFSAVGCAENHSESRAEEDFAEFGDGSGGGTSASFRSARCCDGDHVYFAGECSYSSVSGRSVTLHTLWQYDIRTGEYSPACRDSACNHKAGSGCPFSAIAAGGLVNGFVDNGVYYYIAYTEGSDAQICSYDLEKMQYKVLGDWKPCDDVYFAKAGNKLYFVQFEPHKDDMGFDRYLCSVDITGGKTSRIQKFGDDQEAISPDAIYENKIYYLSFTFDPTGEQGPTAHYGIHKGALDGKGELVCLIDDLELHAGWLFMSLLFQNGRYYYQEITGSDTIRRKLNGGEQEVSVDSFSISSVDPETGAKTLIVDNVIGGFAINGNMLYCFPFCPGKADIGEDTEIPYTSRGAAVKIDLDTAETTTYPISDDIYISGTPDMIVYRGRIYAGVWGLTKEARQKWTNNNGYAVIDLRTGKYGEIAGAMVTRGQRE